ACVNMSPNKKAGKCFCSEAPPSRSCTPLSLLAQFGSQLAIQYLDNALPLAAYIPVSERFAGREEGQVVGQALLPGRDLFPFIHIKQLYLLEQEAPGLANGLRHLGRGHALVN